MHYIYNITPNSLQFKLIVVQKQLINACNLFYPTRAQPNNVGMIGTKYRIYYVDIKLQIFATSCCYLYKLFSWIIIAL